MSVTIKEIARKTGLSIPTVGNVLGNSGMRYSAETRTRVLRAAQELGYRPNASARAMRSGQLGCAALVLSRSKGSTHSHVPTGLIDGLEDELAKHNMHLTVSRLTDEQLSEHDFVPKVLREHMADGMIVNYTHEIPPRMLELIHSHHTPAVWVNAKLDSDCVYPDDLGAARSVTQHLIQLGHRRIALVQLISPFGGQRDFGQAWRAQHYSTIDRALGYGEVMRAAGCTPVVLSHERFVPEPEHLAACRALLSSPDRPTAVLVYSPGEVTSVICAAASLGLSVPRDLSVVVFAPGSMWTCGTLVTAATIPTETMGRRAVQLLLAKRTAPEMSCVSEALAYGLEGEDSIAAPRQR